MKNRAHFSRDVVLRANAQLIEHGGRPAKLPRELLGVVTFRPRTIDEINTAFATAYARLRETEFA
ncbi:hypothetical protein ACIPO9_18385 [Pseudomonas sp. NPDC090203]|uniref:hypothetical protein n=1 Tax=Pseudomonas sp. NPDC090203 TaxID=3364477 RepID=UPI003819755A